MNPREWYRDNLQRRFQRHFNNLRVRIMADRVQKAAPPKNPAAPVLLFKASSGIDDLSWNSAFQVLTAWGLQMMGIPVAFFTCDHGMELCILGTNRDNPNQKPPCASCVYQSRSVYKDQITYPFQYTHNLRLAQRISNLGLEELKQVSEDEVPLGQLVLPGLRWILRRHNLLEDPSTLAIYRKYILSADSIARAFRKTLEHSKPSIVIVFNGQFFPEATVKWVSRSLGYKVISHEVGLRPMTAFFTEGESTAYPIHIPADFSLNESQASKLDAYLEQRFKGDFTMGGVKFWQDIHGIDADLADKISSYNAMVPVFTNVIFDTSQPHANTLFSDMFKWLDLVVEQAKKYPNTLFVIRAHPDETRQRKTSLETVEQWYIQNQVAKISNIHFISPSQYISSYELVSHAKFVMVYNSTIGLEATLLGAAVLCAGKARFTQIPTVFYPETLVAYKKMLGRFLDQGPDPVPAEFVTNAKNFLYFQLFKSSLPFDEFLETGIRVTQSKMKLFNPNILIKSRSIHTIYKGLFESGDFLLEE